MKFGGGECRAKGRVRLHRIRGSAKLREVASGSATQGFLLRNGKVRSQVGGVDRSRFPERRTVGEIRRGGRRARAAPAFLPTALSVALRPLFPFRQAQYAQVFLLKPAQFCTLFAGLGSTYKSAISLLLLSDSRSVLFSIFLLISNSVADLAGTVFSLLLFY